MSFAFTYLLKCYGGFEILPRLECMQLDDLEKHSCSLCGKYQSMKDSNRCAGCLRIESFVLRKMSIVKKIFSEIELSNSSSRPTQNARPSMSPKVVTQLTNDVALCSKLAKQNLEQAIADLERNIKFQESRLKEKRTELKKLKEQLSNL